MVFADVDRWRIICALGWGELLAVCGRAQGGTGFVVAADAVARHCVSSLCRRRGGADSLRQHCGFVFGIVRLGRTLFAEDKDDFLFKGVKMFAGKGIFPT